MYRLIRIFGKFIYLVRENIHIVILENFFGIRLKSNLIFFCFLDS